MTTRLRQWRCAVPLLFICALLAGIIVPAHADTYQIGNPIANGFAASFSNPYRLPFGVDNNVTISVPVLSNGNPAPDGTPVYFNTTLGTIQEVAYTRLGQVTVMLTNNNCAGQAVVTITVGTGRQTLLVEYLGQGGVAVAPPKRLHYRLRAKQVYYGVDKKVFDLRENAIFTAPTFTVTADSIQYDVNKDFLTAQGNVTITAGKQHLSAEKLIVYPTTNDGDLAAITPDIAFKSFTLPHLEAKDDDAARAADYHALSPEPTKTWILCREATVYPHDQIQFCWAKFYLNNFDHLLLVLPLHVLDLKSPDSGAFFNSQISLASDAGMSIDFPIYYAANADHVGALHLSEVSENSPDYHGTGGGQVGIKEDYLLGSTGTGSLAGDALTGPTRSVTWQQAMTYGKTRINLNAADERYSTDTPYTTRLGMSVAQDIGKTNLFLSTSWSTFQGNQNGLEELTAYLPAVKLGKTHFSLSFSPFIGASQTVNTSANDQTTASTTDTSTSRRTGPSFLPSSPLVDETTLRTDLYYAGLRTGLNMPSWRLCGGSLSPTVTHEVSYNNEYELTQTLDTGLNYSRKLGKYLSSTLSYTYSLSDATQNATTTSTAQTASATTATQRVSLNLAENIGQNMFQLYAAYSLPDKNLFGSADTRYYLPWGTRHHKPSRLYVQYAVNLTSTSTAVTQLTAIDHLLSLGWNIGAYNLVLHYSPTGTTVMTGFGSGTGKHWAVEVNRQSW